MKRILHYILVIALLLSIVSCNGKEDHSDTPILEGDEDNGGLQLPEGFSALVVAENLGYGRHIAVNENGDMYISLMKLENGKGIVALRDSNEDGKADITAYFGEFPGTGIGIYNRHLYVGSDTAVIRYKLQPQELIPENTYEMIAGGFPVQYQHAVKPFAFDQEGYMYVNVGAPSNACMEQMRTPGSAGMDPCPQLERHGGIWRFHAETLNQTQLANGYRYATGIRNAVALEWNPASNHLYVVQHGRDQLHQFFPGLYTEDQGVNLPAEEFFLVEEGDDFGWPYCYYDNALNQKVLAPEYGGDGKIPGRCKEKKDPIMAFPAHVAPNDLLFYTGKQFPGKYKNGAFIAFHGSWNRAPQEQEGYYVVFVPFENGLPSGEWEVFADGFAGVEVINSPSDAKHRPCGLAQGPDGSLYVVDSRKGKIWRIFYQPEN